MTNHVPTFARGHFHDELYWLLTTPPKSPLPLRIYGLESYLLKRTRDPSLMRNSCGGMRSLHLRHTCYRFSGNAI